MMSKNLIIAAAVAALCVSGSALADTVTYTLDTLAQWSTPSAPTSGSASLTLSDAGTGLVKVTLTANLTGSQTLTGLWLQAPGLSGVSIAAAPAPAGPATAPTVAYSATATAPQGQAGNTGKYDLKLSFPNNPGGAIQGSAVEVFYLSATNLAVSSFVPAVQTSGQPSPDFYAMMGVTNAAGSGSGLGFWGATTPVPLPAALPLLVAGLGGLGSFARRRRG